MAVTASHDHGLGPGSLDGAHSQITSIDPHDHGIAHTHGIAHDHGITHTHGIAHDHGIAHTHTTPHHDHSIPSHMHGLTYGVFKEAHPASHSATLRVYELVGSTWTLRATIAGLTADAEDVDLTQWITGAGCWRLDLFSAAASRTVAGSARMSAGMNWAPSSRASSGPDGWLRLPCSRPRFRTSVAILVSQPASLGRPGVAPARPRNIMPRRTALLRLRRLVRSVGGVAGSRCQRGPCLGRPVSRGRWRIERGRAWLPARGARREGARRLVGS